MTTRPRPWSYTLIAAVLAVSIGVLLAGRMGTPDDSALETKARSAMEPVKPVAATTSTAPTTTTIPDIEALIPLSTDAMINDVARSVGFVLTEQGTGSGVIISEDLLVTNAHVVWPDRTVTIVFQNGAIHQGRVLALDPFVDLAVVDISRLTRKPPPIDIGSIADVETGDDLYVIGYPAPDEFTPIPTVDVGEILGFSDWEFTGMRWFTIQAPAIGGQSGGAVVDEYGRLIGISTFGSTSSLTSISIDDVLGGVDRLLEAGAVRGIEPRTLPHDGSRRSNKISLEGPWDQQLLLGWFLADADVTAAWETASGRLSATSIGGRELAAGTGSIAFTPGPAFPVVVSAEADTRTDGILESSLPLIAYDDPDHGRALPRPSMTAGVYEVGADRDYFYVTLDEGEQVAVTIESAARTLLVVYGPEGTAVAEDNDISGFIGSNAKVEFTAATSGRYVVSIESSRATISGYVVIISS